MSLNITLRPAYLRYPLNHCTTESHPSYPTILQYHQITKPTSQLL